MESEQHARAIHRYKGPLVIVILCLVAVVGTYLNSDKRWWFDSERILVEKTVTHTPWWMDAAGPILLILMGAVIYYGVVKGYFPRP